MEAQLFDENYESSNQRQLRELVANKLIKYKKINQDKNENSYLAIQKKDLPHQLTAYDVAYVANYLNVGLTLQGDELRIYFSESPSQFVDDYRIDKTFKFQSQLKAYRLCDKVFYAIQWTLIIICVGFLGLAIYAFWNEFSALATNIAVCVIDIIFFSLVNFGFCKLTQKRIVKKLRKVLEKNKLT